MILKLSWRLLQSSEGDEWRLLLLYIVSTQFTQYFEIHPFLNVTLDRTFATNVPSVTRDGMTWRDFVEKNNPDLFTSPSPPSSPKPSSSRSGTNNNSQLSSEPAEQKQTDPTSIAYDTYLRDLDLAFDLLEKLLVPESINRITARDALYHPFLAEPESEDDSFFPHPIGDGRCGQYHFRDEVTEEHYVQIVGPNGVERRGLLAGQGVPIGDHPCEYHQDIEHLESEISEDSREGSGDVDVLS